MALTGETAKVFNDVDIYEETQLQTLILGKTDERVAAIAADPDNPTPDERTFVRVGVVVHRADNNECCIKWSAWKNINTTNYPGLSVNINADLKVMHDAEKTALGL